MQHLAAGLVLVSFLYWLAQTWTRTRSARAVPRLSALESAPLPVWPTVSAIVPARDESTQLRAALEAKRAEGYPALELVVVNDRSTDDTGAIADDMAARDARIRVVHVDALPDGWLGKVHALHRGLERATGEWILFSDADVHIAPATLARLNSWAERCHHDHVAVLPSARPGGALVSLALAAFFRLFSCLVPLWRVPDPGSKVALGSGAFNLFRRSALDASPGLPWLKMEIGDDMALGVMLKRAGARQAVVIGEDHVSLDFYPGFTALARALEKNGAAAPFPLTLLLCLSLVALEAGYLAALLTGGPLLLGLAAATALLAAYTQERVGHWLRFPRWPAVAPFLGAVLLAVVFVRSALLAWLRGGVTWRGTFYSTATVRAGARLGMYGRP